MDDFCYARFIAVPDFKSTFRMLKSAKQHGFMPKSALLLSLRVQMNVH